MSQDLQPLSQSLAKLYSATEVETRWYETWIGRDIFRANASSEKDGYGVLMPPPNVTGMLTMGHVLNHTIQDIYVRHARMSGKETCWFPGLDHAGIATQTKVEQQLAKEEKLTRYDLGREKFIEKVREWKDNYGGIILKQLRRLGNSSDWDRTVYTLDEGASNAVIEVFIRLFDEGLIYRGKRIINWSPVAQSALSDEEVNFKEVKESLYTLRYKLADGSSELHVATVRPETIFGDVAVAVHPEDERYKHLIGKKVVVPIVNREVPVIADEYVEIGFGTGALKITPAHDPNDFELGLKHNLEAINTIHPNGVMNDLAGILSGMERFKARKFIVEKLQEAELIEKIEDYTHNVGFSERGGEPIEPYLSDQWFVRMQPLAAPALEVVQNGEIRFFPDHWTKTYANWMTNIRDWCISRQLWWGHRIPVYYTEDGRFTAAISAEKACEKLGLPPNTPLRQDDDVLDTWFSSWLWPMTTMGWWSDQKSETSPELEKFLPTNLLVTGPDIIFFWVARMIMASLKFTGKIPFRDVYFTSIIRDGKGRKMSKSLGNSPDPLAILDKYGADAVRFTLMYTAPIGLDIRLTVNEKAQDIESMEFGRNFANKIWNAARFLMMKRDEAFEGMSPIERAMSSYVIPSDKLELTERWILSRYNQTVHDARKALELYRLNDYTKTLYDFIWGDFCDWYVECVKIRMNASSDKGYNRALIEFAFGIFEAMLRLLHPVMPFITEELWHAIALRTEKESISTSDFPQVHEEKIDVLSQQHFETVQKVIEEIRALRGLMNIAPGEKLETVISADDVLTQEILAEQSQLISGLCKSSTLDIHVQAQAPQGAISSVVGGTEVFLVIAGLLDYSKEIVRLEKEIARYESMAKTTEAKLSNEKFTANAPEDVVQGERNKLASFIMSAEKLRKNVQQITAFLS